MPADPSAPTISNGSRIRPWTLVVGSLVVLLVAWQLAHGVFVKSMSAPGVGQIDFATPADAVREDANNIIESRGDANQGYIAGGRNNRITQSGTGNVARIGGIPPD